MHATKCYDALSRLFSDMRRSVLIKSHFFRRYYCKNKCVRICDEKNPAIFNFQLYFLPHYRHFVMHSNENIPFSFHKKTPCLLL